MTPEEKIAAALPRTPSSTNAASILQDLLAVMSRLRDPEKGCPWDLKQSFESMRGSLIEEAYEAADAVAQGSDALCEELGDLVLVISLYCQMAEEQSLFSFEKITRGILNKIVRRHPHVFGELSLGDAGAVLQNWEAIKQAERQAAGGAEPVKGLLDSLPRSLPALLRAHRIGEKCARVGFDWKDTMGVIEKVQEEVREFTEAARGVNSPPSAEMREELGDLLFSLVQCSRHLGLNAEELLDAANTKFSQRFKRVEELSGALRGEVELKGLGADKLEELWQIAKKQR